VCSEYPLSSEFFFGQNRVKKHILRVQPPLKTQNNSETPPLKTQLYGGTPPPLQKLLYLPLSMQQIVTKCRGLGTCRNHNSHVSGWLFRLLFCVLNSMKLSKEMTEISKPLQTFKIRRKNPPQA
jgi:hypothetical protein